MITNKKIKMMVGKKGKKISKDAIMKIDFIINEKVVALIKEAMQNADFSGRKLIKKEDIEL